MLMTLEADRLKEARIAAGFATAADAARAIGVKTPTYSRHENGSRGITPDAARLYGRAFKVGPEWILYGRAPEAGAPTEEAVDLVNVYDVQASAGNGVVVYDEQAVAQLAFPPGYLAKLTSAKPKDLKIISVKGDSMLPTLADDDVVMLDLSKRDLSYDGLFVIRDGGDALLVKRIGRASQRGFVTIISDNRNVYPSVEKSLQDIEVVGRVIWRGGKV